MFELPKDYVSVSQINTYLGCPKKYEYAYLMDLPQSKSSALATGSAFHQTIERVSEQGGISEDYIKKIYEDSWKENDVGIDWKEEEDPTEEKERGYQLAKAYLESDIGKSLDPLGLEVNFQIEVDGIPFIGYIDVIEKGGYIRDLKTSRKSPAKDVAEKSLQLSGYALAYRELIGEKEKSASLDYAISLKRGIKVERFETEISDGRIDRFRDTLFNVASGIDKEVFPRNEGMMCGYCSFRDMCLGNE